jgi:hypothetical protein
MAYIQAEADMGIRCQVFIDGSSTGEAHTFPSVPRSADEIAIARNGERLVLIVESVRFVAQATDENMSDGSVYLKASTGS